MEEKLIKQSVLNVEFESWMAEELQLIRRLSVERIPPPRATIT